MGCIFGRPPETSDSESSMPLVRFVGSTTNSIHVPILTLVYDLKVYESQHGVKIYLNKGSYTVQYGNIVGRVLRFDTLKNFRFFQIGFSNGETAEIFLDSKLGQGIYVLPKQSYRAKIRN
jgi:hypothetical protein